MMIFWWILLIAGFVVGIKWLTDQKSQHGESATDILKKRYAGGEISKEEFEEKKKELV